MPTFSMICSEYQSISTALAIFLYVESVVSRSSQQHMLTMKMRSVVINAEQDVLGYGNKRIKVLNTYFQVMFVVKNTIPSCQ